MNVRRIKTLVWKEFIQVARDIRSLWMAVAIPVILLTLFGYALTLDVDQVPLVIWDQNNTAASRDFTLRFKNSPYFNVIRACADYRCVDTMINHGHTLMAMVIPKDFSSLLERGDSSPVQLLVDGSDSNTATIAIGYADAITAAHNKMLFEKSSNSFGLPLIEPLHLLPRVWFNETLKSKNFIIPGLIAVIMMIVSALLTGLTVAREWERGTMEQLISTPMKAGELIAGKFIPYFVIGMLDVLIAVLMGQFLFHVPLRGNVFLLFVLSGLFLSVTLGWGLFVSIVTKSQFMASQIAFITTFLPAFLLSGFAFPIANMPKAIQIMTFIVPARYFVTILKGIYLKGIGVRELWPQIAALMFFSIILTTAANRKFKKTIV